ncbi:MAG: hypothetical protein ACK5ES_24520, partial [Planctomyces sp.]
IKLLGLIELEGGGYIESYAGVQRVMFYGGMELLGFRVDGSGFFSTEGEFDLSFGGGVRIGAIGFGVSGYTNFRISRLDHNGTEAFGDGNFRISVSGMVEGSVELFGFSLASASITFGLDGQTGRVYITPKIKINLLFFKIEVSHTFTLFYVKMPKPVYLAGNAGDTSGTGFNRGVLYLNMGPRAHLRNESVGEVNEGFIVEKIARDPDYPGEIVRVQAFGRSQSFRGVTGIVADTGDGYNYVKIGDSIRSPVTLTGGGKRDWLLHSGTGDAVFNAGDDDDEIQGGLGRNTYIMKNAFGRDVINSLSTDNYFDLSGVTENLTGSLTADRLIVAPSGYNRLVTGVATINGLEAKLLPLGIDRVTAILPGHTFKAGQKVRVVAPGIASYTGEFIIESVVPNALTFAAVSFDRPLPTGTPTKSGPIFHDGVETAYIRTTIEDWHPGYILNLESSTNAYNGPIQVNRVDANWYSFNVKWEDVRESVDTAVLPTQLILGSGNDHLTIPGDLNYSLNLVASGGYDTLRIVGSLNETQTIVLGQYTNNQLNILWTGIERVDLVDPTVSLTINGGGPQTPISLGSMSLGIVAQSLLLTVDITADDFEVNVRDSLNLANQLTINELDLRVLGDDQDLTVTRPIVATTAQLTAPDGTVTIPDGTQFTGQSLAIKARQLITGSGTLNLSTDQLSVVVSSVSTTDLIIINDRDLLLTSEMDETHLVPLDGLVAEVFDGITWVAGVASEWAEQVFDGWLNPFAVAASGLISISLPAQADDGDEDTLTVQGGLRSWSGNISITTDEVDFLGGPDSVKASGTLNLKAATSVWTYRLGTSAETGGGGAVDPALAPKMLDLPTRDLAALANGFTSITIGRNDTGNLMRLGDAFSMTTVKATGEARAIDASIKDPLTLLTDSLIVEGDFRTPLDPLLITANTAEVRRLNLHTPN